jgi:hypothetical protein
VYTFMPGDANSPMNSNSYLGFTEERWARIERKFRIALWAGGAGTALVQAWAFRHLMNPDGISYLDMATSLAQGHWRSLVSGYWSPLYPFLLGVALRVLRPSPAWESTVAHFLNAGIFIAALFCFELFLKALNRGPDAQTAAEGREPMPADALSGLGRAVFLCYTLLFVHIELIVPDMCVVAVVFLASTLLVRIQSGDGGWAVWAAFGAVLGIAYLSKAVMFPISFAFLACGLFAAKPWRRSIPGTAMASIAFILVSAPFILALSNAKGRPTYGESGKIAYAEHVDGARWPIHWQGGPPGTGAPVHPTRLLLANPPLYEFSGPVAGTYPPWYDPSYWYEGVVPIFRLHNQLRAIRYRIEEFAGIFPYMGGVLVGLLAMALLAGPGMSMCRDLIATAQLWIPGAMALALYGLVYVEARYVEPFIVLICMALLAGLRFPISGSSRAAVRCIALATALACCIGIVWLAGRAAFRALSPQPFVEWEVVEGLRASGVGPRDKVGTIGDGLHAYWAHLDGVRIVAEIPLDGAAEFWSSNPEVQSRALALFAGTGANLVVATPPHPSTLPEGWKEIGRTGFFAYDFADRKAPGESAK